MTTRPRKRDVPGKVTLRGDDPVRHVVWLEDRTAAMIAEQLKIAAPLRVEWGGGLFASYSSLTETRVVLATGPGPGSRHGWDWLSLSTESQIRSEFPP